MKELLVIDADYIVKDDKSIVRLLCKDKKGKIIIFEDDKFQSYFYIHTNSTEYIVKKLKEYEFGDAGKVNDAFVVEKILDGIKTKLVKVVVDNPRNVPKIRDVVKEWKDVKEQYEYAISFVYRYLLDKQIQPMKWILIDDNGNIKEMEMERNVDFRVLAFDIEVVEEEKEEKIIMISVFDNKGYEKVFTTHHINAKFVESMNNEEELIKRFIEVIKERDPDFICTYNGDAFDFAKLRERCDKLKIKLNLGRDGSAVKLERRGRTSAAIINGRVHIDLFNFVNHILSPSMKTEVLTLDAVARELLGEGKIDVKWKEIKESWKKKKDLERIAQYSLRDSELTLMLADYLLPQIFSLSRLTMTLPFDTSRYYYSQLVEHFLMRKSVADNRIIPNMPKYDEIEKRKQLPSYTGAIVIEPKTGIHNEVMVFDFQSLYPTIIVTHNISPETLDCGHSECRNKNQIPDSRHYFCMEKKGFVPKHLEEIIIKRREVKEKMKKLKSGEEYNKLKNYQYSLKIIANATYGYFGYAGARWYCRDCAEACAAFGRHYITYVLKNASESGFDVIYADTDSCFLTASKIPKIKAIEKAEIWHEKINKDLPGIIELEFRGSYVGGLFVSRKGEEKGAKKRYALIDDTGNLEIRGFETVRRDWCDLAKHIQHEVLKIILKDREPDKAIKLVRDTVKRLKDGKAKLEELTIYTQLTMPLADYKQIAPHVKAAMKIKERGKPIGEGMIIEYVITKGKGSISDRAEPVEDVKEGQYDPEYYINNQILPAAMRVLQALNLTEEDVLKGKTQVKLNSWFKK